MERSAGDRKDQAPYGRLGVSVVPAGLGCAPVDRSQHFVPGCHQMPLRGLFNELRRESYPPILSRIRLPKGVARGIDRPANGRYASALVAFSG